MKYELLVIDGPEAGRTLTLRTDPLLLGRSAKATVSFPTDIYMSGLHLQVQETSGGVMLTDLRSTNGTFLNGQRVQQAIAVSGDLVRVGGVSLKVVLAEEPTKELVVAPASTPSAVFASSTVLGATPVLSALPPAENTPVRPAKREALLDILLGHTEPLFCLVDAAVDPAIYSLLESAQQHPVQCLYDGASATTLGRWAPFLVSVSSDSAFLRTLIEKGWGKGWASYFVSSATFEQLRHHFRRFLMVQLEEGQQVYFRFYDPRVLREFLPTASAEELSTFFGPVTEWMLESADPKMLLRMRRSNDELLTAVSSLADPAA